MLILLSADLLLKAEQMGLFEATAMVKPHVRKDGVLVKPHARKVKRRAKPTPAKVRSHDNGPVTLDLFASDHHEGDAEPHTLDLFASPHSETAPPPPQQESELEPTATPEPAALPIVEHQTKRRLLRGVIARDMTQEQAKTIDPYTFKKDGGWFIREKHLVDGRIPEPGAIEKPEPKKKPAAKKKAAPKPDPKPEPIPAPLGTTGGTGGIDYFGPFDPSSITPFGVAAGVTEGERRALNARAVEIINSKSADQLTDEDREVLSKYSGTGGIGDSLNEFYTDTRVAGAIWKSLYDMGLPEGAEAFEPSCATGVFMHTAPAGVRVTGVEMDPNSAKIGEYLHGGEHEYHNASLERFATQDPRRFDAVIGNPPFGLRGSLLKDDKPDLSTAESYFIDTALDKCKPGGMVALVVPTGVLDSKTGRAFRERMLRKGQFLGAMRMPNTAFKHAHTGVTTDVIYLRKRPDDVAGALMTVPQETLRKLGVWDEDFLSGAYFTEGEGKDNILGTMTDGWRAKAGMGQDITVEGSMVGVPEAIAGFRPASTPQGDPTVPDIVNALGDDEDAVKRALGGAAKRPYGDLKEGATKVVDGVTYVLQGDPLRWHRVENLMEADEVADALPLAEEIERLMSGGAVDRPALEAGIREYIDKYGIPTKSSKLNQAAGDSKVLYRLIGAVKPNGELSDVVTGKLAERLEGGFDVIAHSLAKLDGQFTPEELAERAGKDTDDALDHLYASGLYAHDPDTGKWTTIDAYVSGELWPKLDAVNAAIEAGGDDKTLQEKYREQAAKLEEAIDPKSLEDVTVELNNAWIPLDIVSEYFTQKNANGNQWQRDLPPVSITFADGVYTVKGGNEYGELKIVDKYLNRTGVRKDDLPQLAELNRDFKDWLCASEYRERVEELYNRKFRGFREREYSNDKFDIPGLNDEGLKDYQYGGLRWALDRGKGIVAADVGLGKTARGLILSRMAKVNGQAKKPIIVVPKSVLANWVTEAEKWFPGSRVLTIGAELERDENGDMIGRDDTAADRKRKYHDLTQNDYDFVLVSQPAFNELDLNPELKNKYLDEDFWVQRGDSLGQAGDKRIKRVREQFEQSAAKRDTNERTDAIYFDDLGVDMVMVDEGHAYKNLYSARSRFGESPKYLGGQGLSNRAFDMSFKAKYIRDNNDGNNVYMLTATPTKNSPLEIYSMLSYIAPEAFEAIGIRNSEEFIDRFCKFERENILGTKGNIEEALVTTGFKNMDELREIMRRYIDRTTAEDVGLELPARDDRMHLVDMDEAQQSVYADLRAQAEESASKRDATGDAHIFSIMDKMNKAATDLGLLGDEHAGHDSPKYAEAVKTIVSGAQEGGQVVFADYIDSHKRLVDMLVAKGIKRKQIAIVNARAAGSSARRQKISDDFNAGKLKVVIGNTATMGEGMNLQMGTTDIHHLDIPWEPASIQQRNGRGLRQGNTSESVRLHTYLSKGSFDGYRWMTVNAKRDWQDLLWNGGDTIDNYSRQGNLSREDMMVMLSASPEEARAKLEADKADALKRHTAERRRDAAGKFSRLRQLQANYAALKSKRGKAAARLAAGIEKTKNQLFADKYFEPKELLEKNTPAIIHADSGKAITAGTLLTPGENSKIGGPVVVTGVRRNGELSVRRHGVLKGGSFTLEASDIDDGVMVSKNDDKAEAAAIAEQAKAKITSDDGIKAPHDLRDVPPAAVAESYDAIQTRLKNLAASYGDRIPHGRVLVLNPEGKMSAEENYSYRGLVNEKDYDFVLPTPEHREKAIEAWIENEKAKTFGMEFQSGTRRNSSGNYVFRAKYPGGYNVTSNTIGDAGKSLFGEDFIAEASKRLQDEVATNARRAGSVKESAEAMKPLVEVAQYGGGMKWPRRALSVLYVQAKKTGALGKPFDEVMPARTDDGPTYLDRLFRKPSTQNDGTLGAALVETAKSSGYRDLAAAMTLEIHKDNPKAAFSRIAADGVKVSNREYGYRSNADFTTGALQAMLHLAEKHPELGDKEAREFSSDLRFGAGYNNEKFDGKGHLTLREALAQALEA